MPYHHPSFLFQFGPSAVYVSPITGQRDPACCCSEPYGIFQFNDRFRRYGLRRPCPCRGCTMPGKVDFPRRADVSVTVYVSPTRGAS